MREISLWALWRIGKVWILISQPTMAESSKEPIGNPAFLAALSITSGEIPSSVARRTSFMQERRTRLTRKPEQSCTAMGIFFMDFIDKKDRSKHSEMYRDRGSL